MPSNVQNAIGRDQNKTFGQLFEGLSKEEKQYDILKEKLIEYISTYNDFSLSREQRLDDYLSDLDNIGDHWDEINQWIEKNSDLLDEFAGTFSDIRGIFQEIVTLTQRSGSIINERQRIARNVRDLALESENIARREGGLTDSQVVALSRKAAKAKENVEYQIKVLTGGSLEQEAIYNARAREQSLLEAGEESLLRSRREERNLRNRLSQVSGRERAQIIEKIRAEKDYQRELELENKIHAQALEFLSTYAKQAAESLVDLTSKLKEYYRLEKSEPRNKAAQVSLVSKMLRKGGMTAAAANLEEDNNEFISRKVEAHQRRDRAAVGVSVAEKALDRSLEDAKTAGFDLSRESDISSLLKKTTADLNKAKASLGVVDAFVDKDLQNSVYEAKRVVEDLKKQLVDLKEKGSFRVGDIIESNRDLSENAGQFASRERVINPLEDKLRAAEKDVLDKEKKLADARTTATAILEDDVAKLERKHQVLSSAYGKQQDLNRSLSTQKSVDEETEKILSEEYRLSEVIKNNLEDWLRPLMSASALAGAIFTNFLKINGETAHVKQLIGEWTMGYARANWGQATILETTKLIAELTERMGSNPVAIFTSREMGQVSEAKKLLGLTADQAAGLAVQSKLNGVYANQYREALQKGIGAGQILNKTVVSQGVATREALAASDAIKLSMGNNAEQIGKAVVAAKALGMSLQDVENISRNLINFESSIQAEMQAQLLTGKQLNLAKARELALNNDLEGVAKEIGRQGVTMAQFGHWGYIQQENMAKALGMSRDQLAKMLVTQALSEGLTAKQIAAAGLMNEKQIEAISLQENWKTMLSNILGMLTPILQLLNPIVELASKLIGLVSGLFGYLLEPLDRLSTHLSSVIGKWEGWGKVVRKTNEEGVNFIQILGSIAITAGLVFLAARRGLGGLFRPVLSIARGILGWIPAITRAGAAARAARAPLNTLNRDVHTPGGTGAPQGPSRMGRLFGKLGRNVSKIVAGAFAMGLMSLALMGFAKACQMMPENWNPVFMAIAGLAALTGAVIALGVVGTAAAPMILAGAAAMILVAGSVWVLGKALQEIEKVNWETIGKLPVALLALAAAGVLSIVAGPSLLIGSAALLVATPMLLAATGALSLVAKPLAKAATRISDSFTALSAIKFKKPDLSELKEFAAELKEVSGELKEVRIPTLKLGAVTALSGIVGRITSRRRSAEVPAETLQESQENKKENIEASVQSITIKQAEVQASAQKFTVEQKSADLSRIEQKMDAVIKAVKDAAPTGWDWVRFGQEFGKSVPFANR